MRKKAIKNKLAGIYIHPWLIVGAALILLIVVVVLAINNINREKRYMTKILSEKGEALITAIEAGARTGMMGMMWGGDQVQTLLEETARQPGILYLAVADENGLVLAHSDRTKIGQRFNKFRLPKAIDPHGHGDWRLIDQGGEGRSFEVFRYFCPLTGSGNVKSNTFPSGIDRPGMMRWSNNWCFPSSEPDNQQIVFVGLDVKPFEEARKEDLRNTITISSVLLLLGLGGFLSMFLAQGYRATRRLLQDTSAYANEVVTNLPVGLITTGQDGRISFLNEAAERITGINLDTARGKEPDDVLPPDLCGLKEFLGKGQVILEREMECSFAGRGSLPLSVSATQIFNEEGYFVGNILILRDLGEVRRLQEEIRRKEKLAALGSLAAGVSHEIRNPLSSIKGLATYFGGKFPEGSEDRETAGVMVREVDRVNRVITQLLDFAKPAELLLKPTSVNDLLENSIRLVQQDAKTKNIAINLLKGNDLSLVQLDPDRFTQCLLNLYLNAIQAMDNGGVLSVKSSLSGDHSIRIEIADTGAGISPADLSKIFDPYFTTKSKGTGLGLAIVHKIIEAHQGSIMVKSAPGKGAIFTILIGQRPIDRDKRGNDESS